MKMSITAKMDYGKEFHGNIPFVDHMIVMKHLMLCSQYYYNVFYVILNVRLALGIIHSDSFRYA